MVSGERTSRGQSNPVAVVLILAVVLVSATVVAGLGAVTLETGRDYAETQRGEYAVSQFDSKASSTALEGAGPQTVDLAPHGDASVRVEETGRMSLFLVNSSLDSTSVATIRSITNDSVMSPMRNRTLGAVVHRSGDREVGFQAGGVWRRSTGGNASAMVTPPEIHYNRQTLTLPLVTVAGNETDAQSLRVEKTRRTTKIYPNGTNENLTNPVPPERDLVIVVQSRYYRAWHQFFETRIGGEVFYPNGTDSTVAVRLTAFSVDKGVISGGLISVGTSDVVEMGGEGNRPAFIDSYDSSNGTAVRHGTYENSSSDNGSVKTASGIILSGGSHINGTVRTGGSVTLNGDNTRIFGNAAHQGMTEEDKDQVTGWTNDNGSAPSVPPIDQIVADQVSAIEGNNNNSHPDSCVDENQESFDISGNNPTVVCEAGNYYVDGKTKLSSGETIVIDLSEGNVSIALDGDLTVGPGAEIRVENTTGNNNTANIWFAGNNVKLKGNVTIRENSTNRTFEAPRLRLYGPSTTSVDMNDGVYVGVIYVPTENGGSSLDMQGGSDIFGAAVVGKVDMQAGSRVHYDRALEGRDIISQDEPAASQLSYLHITINEVRVTG